MSYSLSVSTLIDDFLRYSRYERVRPIAGQTVETYIKRLEKLRSVLGMKLVASLTKEDIRSYRAQFLERGCLPSYANAHMMILRAFLRYCKEERELSVIDSHEVKLLPRGEPKVRYLRPEEIMRFIVAIDTTTIYGLRFMAIVTTLLDTAMRISECLSLDRNIIDWETKSAFIIGKGAKEGMITFRSWSEYWIKEYLKARKDICKALFVSHNPQIETKRAVAEDIRRYFRCIGKKAGLGRVHPHMLRKTAGTALYEGCSDMRLVQQFLRHSRITTTEWYVGTNFQRLQRMHEEHLHYGKAEEIHIGVKVISAQWTKSGKYHACLSCQKTERPHVARGYCDSCYVRRWRKGLIKPKYKENNLTEAVTFDK